MSYSVIFDALARGLIALFISGVVLLAYYLVSIANLNRQQALFRGIALSLVFAFFVARLLGEPSCLEYGLKSGLCEVYSDDGFIPTPNQRLWSFVFWSTVLVVPVTISSIKNKK